jgi:hypothetical protein
LWVVLRFLVVNPWVVAGAPTRGLKISQRLRRTFFISWTMVVF